MKASNDFSCMAMFGYIVDYDEKRHMAKVNFPEKNIVSSWLPVIVPNSKENHDELHLDLQEHVACIMLGTGLETGFILGSVYDDKNKPVIHDKDVRMVKFSDDTTILYDRRNHKMQIDVHGDIEISATGNIRLQASEFQANNLHVDNISVDSLSANSISVLSCSGC